MLQLDGTGPLYQQIYRAFRKEILSGHLAPGERVPSTRVLTDLLKVSRNTAVLAYEQLLAEGYLETRVGASGTVVAPVLPADSIYFHSSELLDRQRGSLNRSNAKLNLGANTTAPALRFPARSALWCRLLGARARRSTRRDLDYGPPAGRWELREAIATRLRRLRGIDAGPERIVIVNGTQRLWI
jgi:GntR family transcriptional regulator/MocR family aminotransferase